jgi:hypothetical protein
MNVQTLVFSGPEVQAVLRDALAATAYCDRYGEQAQGPELILVHDNGIYLISNRDGADPAIGPIAYAQGCDPNRDPDVAERSRGLYGERDVIDPIEIDDEIKAWLELDLVELRLTLTEDEISLEPVLACPQDLAACPPS